MPDSRPWSDVPVIDPLDRHWDLIDARTRGLPTQVAAQRRARRKRFAIVAMTTVLALVVGLVIGTTRSEETSWLDSSRDRRSDAATVFGVLMSLTGVALWVVGVVQVLRKGRFAELWSDPLSGIPWRDRRSIERKLRSAAPPEPGRAPVLRRLAALRLRQTEWTIWFLAGWVPFAGGQAIASPFEFFRWMQTGGVLLFLVVFMLSVRQRARWRALIDVTEPD